MDSKFEEILQLCINSYVGLHQPRCCPDLKVTIDSTTESLIIEIWLHGYLSNVMADYKFYLDNESSDADIDMVKSILELCITTKEIYLKNFENNS